MTRSPNQMTVDVLVTSDARRGAEVFGSQLVHELNRRDWDVQLVSLTGGTGGIESKILCPSGASQLRVLRALRRHVRRRRPDLVLANGGSTLRQGVLASLPSGPPVVYGAIGEPAYWLRGQLHRRLQRFLVGRCAHVISVSEATKAGLMETVAVDSRKVTVIHQGVDESWTEIPLAPVDAGPLRVLYAGSLSSEKDPLTAVAVARRLPDRVVLRMAGDGPLRTQLEASLPPNVEVLGSVPDMREQFAWAHLLLLPSRTEGLPAVAVEASASGVAVVASDVGGVSEIVIDGQTGRLIEAGDVDGFVEAISHLADDRSQLDAWRIAARRRAMSAFRLEDTVDRYADVFRRVVGR